MIYLFQPLDLGKADKKSTGFFDSYMAVEQRHLVLEEEDFKVRRREQKKKLALYQKGFAAIQDAIRNQNPKAIESVKADKDLYEVVCEIITKLDAKLEGTQADGEPEKAPKIDIDPKDRASAASNLKQEARMLKMRQVSDETMNDLLSLMEKDYAIAAKTLVEIVEPLCTLLHIMVRRKPELFRPIARKAFMWPVLVRQRSNWVKETKEILSNLEFGEETFYARFRKALIFDDNHPARSYAMALVQNIEFNRYYLATISSRMPAIQSLIEDGYPTSECCQERLGLFT